MDVVYEILETLHVFIPVVAIVVCVVIFVCGIRSSKSAQPPDEYLQEIKANSASKKTKNKTAPSKVLTQKSVEHTGSPKSANSVIVVEAKREKTPASPPKQVEVAKKGKKSAKNALTDSTHGPVTSSPEVAESTPWVVVTPKRKQKDVAGGQMASSPQSSPSADEAPAIEEDFTPVKRRSSSVLEAKEEIVNQSVEAIEKKLATEVAAPASPVKAKVVHESDEEAWSIQTSKDSRYRKNNKKKGGGGKNDVSIDEASNVENLSSPDDEPFIPVANETRRRRNVRKE